MTSARYTDLSDEELVERYRAVKTELAGHDPQFRQVDEGRTEDLIEEMTRRGLAPDREDVIPDTDSERQPPVVGRRRTS